LWFNTPISKKDEVVAMARPSPLITRLRFLLVLLLLVGSLGLWWHHSQPKTFRLVKKFPLELCPTSQYGLHSDDGTAICRGIFYTNYGVYVRENAKKLVLYDWVGNKAWTIEVEESDYSAFARKVSSPRTKEGIPATSTGFITVFPWWAYNRLTCVAVSPSGRYVVTGVIKPGNVVVTTWSDGKRIGCCSLPLYVDNYERFPIIINVMDTGNTLVAVLRKKEVTSI